MGNEEHLRIFISGVENWNKWRIDNPNIIPDLSGFSMTEMDLEGINFRKANLQNTELSKSNLTSADFSDANMYSCDLSFSDLSNSNFQQANMRSSQLTNIHALGSIFVKTDLRESTIIGGILSGANLTGADLSGSLLNGAHLVRTTLTNADISNCNVYGISVWDTDLTGCHQNGLIITPYEVPYEIRVDTIQLAQFMYLILNNEELSDFIKTSTKKIVLILGRFTPDRKKILDSIRSELYKRDHIPIIFDFESSKSRNLTETVSLLAHMAKFVIADITEPKSIPQELERIIPHMPSLKIMPIIEKGHEPYSMYEHFKNYPWVLELVSYVNEKDLLDNLLPNKLDSI